MKFFSYINSFCGIARNWLRLLHARLPYVRYGSVALRGRLEECVYILKHAHIFTFAFAGQ